MRLGWPSDWVTTGLLSGQRREDSLITARSLAICVLFRWWSQALRRLQKWLIWAARRSAAKRRVSRRNIQAC